MPSLSVLSGRLVVRLAGRAGLAGGWFRPMLLESPTDCCFGVVLRAAVPIAGLVAVEMVEESEDGVVEAIVTGVVVSLPMYCQLASTINKSRPN